MPKTRILKSFFLITIAYFFSLVINVAVQVILAGQFGAGLEMDSYLVALTIPSFFILIFSTALSKVFTPIFIDYQVKKGQTYIWVFTSNFINISALMLLLLLLAGEVFVKQCVFWLAPGLSKSSYDLAVSLMRIFLPSVFFGGITTILTSLYYAHNRFLLPSLGLILNSAVILFAVLILKNTLGIYSVAWGVFLGGVVQCIFLAPILWRRYSFSFNMKEEGLQKFSKLLFPVLIGAFFYKAIGLIEKNIASSLSVGSISHLGYAYRIIPILLVLASSGISTILFPLLSKYASLNDWVSVKKGFLSGISSLVILISPIVIYLIVLRIEVIKLLYERGQFTAQNTTVISSLFAYYLIALFFMVVSTVPSQIYTIMQNTKILIPIGVIETVAYLGYCFYLSKLFGLQGIAYAFALYYLGACVINYVVLYSRLKSITLREICLPPFKIISTALLSGYFLNYLNVHLRPFLKSLPEVLFITIIISASLVLYFLMMHYLHIAEIGEIKGIIFAKLKGNSSVVSPLSSES